jgi:hypothetical protein
MDLSGNPIRVTSKRKLSLILESAALKVMITAHTPQSKIENSTLHLKSAVLHYW